MDPLKLWKAGDLDLFAGHNHGYPTVDPLKLPFAISMQLTSPMHNHGYPTVDPLKLDKFYAKFVKAVAITTVIRPWTH